MEINVNGQTLQFVYRGFEPLYTYEVITGERFDTSKLRNIHLLYYATLICSNRDQRLPKFEEFAAWLYENPSVEADMQEHISSATEARLSSKKK